MKSMTILRIGVYAMVLLAAWLGVTGSESRMMAVVCMNIWIVGLLVAEAKRES